MSKDVIIVFPSGRELKIGTGAKNWGDACIFLYDYAQQEYKAVFKNQWNNFGQLRQMCFDRMLTELGHDPRSWKLSDNNTTEDARGFVIQL